MLCVITVQEKLGLSAISSRDPLIDDEVDYSAIVSLVRPVVQPVRRSVGAIGVCLGFPFSAARAG